MAVMGFLLGLMLGMAGGGYLAYRYHAAIQDWLDMRGE